MIVRLETPIAFAISSLVAPIAAKDGNVKPIKIEKTKKQVPPDVGAQCFWLKNRQRDKWTHPEGGLFMWVTVPERINTTEMMKKCVDNNVAYVPGVAFYPGRTKTNNFRLNYSNMDEERIVIGIKRIAEVIKNELK